MKSPSYRAIKSSFWTDMFVLDLEPEEKLLYVWLLTNEHLDICGCYQVSLKTMEYETGIEKGLVRGLLRGLQEASKLRYCEETKEVILLKWRDNNAPFFNPANRNVFLALKKGCEKIKTPEFKAIVSEWLGESEAPTLAPTLAPTTQPEPEPEPELKDKGMSVDVEISEELPKGEALPKSPDRQAANALKSVSLTETAIRECVEERKGWLEERYPGVDVGVELEEIVAKYRDKSIGCDTFLIVSRWFKHLQPRSRDRPVVQTFAQMQQERDMQVYREFAAGGTA